MRKPAPPPFQLSLPGHLKTVLSEIAWATKKKLSEEVNQRISNHAIADIDENPAPPKEFTNQKLEKYGFRIEPELKKQIKSCAVARGASMNAEILRRLYLSNPLADLAGIHKQNTSDYPHSSTKQREAAGYITSVKDNPACSYSMTPDEKELLTTYRAASKDQKHQISEIISTFKKH